MPNREHCLNFNVICVACVIRATHWRIQGQERTQHLARVVYSATAHHRWLQEICSASARVQEIATKLQGGEECVGKERAGGAEKTWLESGTDVDQVRGTLLSPAVL